MLFFVVLFQQTEKYVMRKLPLILGFLFLDLLEEEFKKKSAILFVIVHTLLIYTFTLSFILSFFYAFIGFIYLLIKKRNIKEKKVNVVDILIYPKLLKKEFGKEIINLA